MVARYASWGYTPQPFSSRPLVAPLEQYNAAPSWETTVPADLQSPYWHCEADVDDGSGTGWLDGAVDIADLLHYLSMFDLGLAGADVDDGSATGVPDAAVDIGDLLYFLARFDAGC